MGNSKISYDDYINDIDYWLWNKGIELPLWANELAERDYPSVCAIDFYDDIFGDDLEPERMPEDYRAGEYAGIAVERIPCKKKDKKTGEMKDSFKGRRVTVTQGNQELYNLIDESENFCMISPISYAGIHRTNKNARYMYALVIEIDDITDEIGIKELIYSWNRENQRMPQPTYIVCSGSGLHLYFVFERPIPLFQNIFEQLSAVKKYFTKRFWNKYVTNSHQPEKIQYESINQPFRCVGSITKNGKGYVMAFETGSKITVEYLNSLLPDKLKMNEIYKSKLSLADAEKQYPEWYQRRIVEGKGRGHWNRHDGIYFNWIEKVKEGAVVGHRYNCLENLCSLAVQCQIEPRQVEKDCRELAAFLETLTNDEKNHFTEYDILCALKTYHNADEGAYRRKIEYISNKTGITLTPNKRRKKPLNRADGTALKAARAMQNIIDPDGEWRYKGGAPTAEQKVLSWQRGNPGGKKADCIRETGLSKPTVYKWWDEEL